MMMGTDVCSSRMLSLPRYESGDDEELTVLPRHTKVVVICNNRTKSVLVGLQGVVKKAVGLGGWHWLAAVRQRRRMVVSAAARGLTASAGTTLTLFVALPDKSKGRLAIAALANLLDGGIQLILGEMLGGATDRRALDRALHIFLFVAVFLFSGALPIIATVLPAVGGQAAILVAAAIGVAGIATFASKAEAKSAGVHVIIL